MPLPPIPLPESKVGVLFPAWMSLFTENFYQEQKEGKIPKLNTKRQPLPHQEFIKEWIYFMSTKSTFQGMLMYHFMGVGKTCASLLTYNRLIKSDPSWQVFILIKNSLTYTWKDEIEICVEDDHKIRENIHIINYDGTAKKFLEVYNKFNKPGSKNLFLIEEGHLFISNVYSNKYKPSKKKTSARALTIYNTIKDDLAKNKNSRVIVMTGSPVVNTPFELSILFNLLHPGLFPEDEQVFESTFLHGDGAINLQAINSFQRRITPFVSFVVPSTDDFASSEVRYVKIPMTEYQENVYKRYQASEQKVKSILSKGTNGTNYAEGTFNIYTRQACNFVMPEIDKDFNSYSRRSLKSLEKNTDVREKLTEDQLSKLMDFEEMSQYDGKMDKLKESKLKKVIFAKHTMETFDEKLSQYFSNLSSIEEISKEISSLINTYELKYKEQSEKVSKSPDETVEQFKKRQEKLKSPIAHDIVFQYMYKDPKCKMVEEMVNCSPKMTYIALMLHVLPGVSIAYSNWIRGEGLQFFQIFLNCLGFYKYGSDSKFGKLKKAYVCFTGEQNLEQRQEARKLINSEENKYGDKVKLLLLSKAGAEGITIECVRSIFIMEPYYQEVLLQQITGRGIRNGSHKKLPAYEHHVDVYRLLSQVSHQSYDTIDELIDTNAKKKQMINDQFLRIIREVAIDCSAFSAENMKNPNVSKYMCFRFDDEYALGDKGFAYSNDLDMDILESKGMNSINSKVVEINTVLIKIITPKGRVLDALIENETGYIYHPKTKQIMCQIQKNELDMPMLDEKGNYMVKNMIEMYDF